MGLQALDGRVIQCHSVILNARAPRILQEQGLSLSSRDGVLIPFESGPVHFPASTGTVLLPLAFDVLNTIVTFIYTDDVVVVGNLSIAVFVAAKRLGLDALAAKANAQFTSGITSKNVLRALAIVSDIPDLVSCLTLHSREHNLTNLSVSHLPLEQSSVHQQLGCNIASSTCTARTACCASCQSLGPAVIEFTSHCWS